MSDARRSYALKLFGWTFAAWCLLAAGAAQALTEDLTTQFVITRSGLVLNRTTNTFDSTVTLKNSSGAPVLAPIEVAVAGLPAGVTLANKTGDKADGRPYVSPMAPGSMLANGSTLSFALKFANPARVNFNSTLQILRTIEVPANAPSLLGVVATGGTSAHIIGRADGAANQDIQLQLTASNTCVAGMLFNGTNVGGTVTARTDASGYFQFDVSGVNPGTFVALKNATAGSPLSLCQVSSRDNVSWPKAFLLEGDSPTAQDFIDAPGKARWYKFPVTPGQRIDIKLSGLPADYDLAAFKDIGQAFASQFNPTTAGASDLLKLTAEYAPSTFSPSTFSPSTFSPSTFSPDAYSPSTFSPSTFSPSTFSPSTFSPSTFSPSTFSPSTFSPSTFSPSTFSPSTFSPSTFSPSTFSATEIAQAFSTAQTRSIVAISATAGLSDEATIVNTWNRTGYFYVRVTGRGGAFDTSVPFTLRITKGQTTCAGVTDTVLTPRPAVAASGLKTVLLTDSSKVALDAALTGPLGGTLRSKLDAFAARAEIGGVVIDVAGDARVSALKQQAASNPACPFAKNLVAEEVKGIVDAYRANPLQYVVIVGNDDAIPFFRSPDESAIGQESGYVPPVQSNSPSEASLRRDFVLSQDRYGSKTSISLPWNEFPVPGLAVGRLIETAGEIAGLIDAYVGADAVVSPHTSLVTGYDFLEDAANAVKKELDAGTGAPGDALITPNGVSPQAPTSWKADQLRAQLFGARHDVIFLAGHFSANSALAADFATSVLTTDLAASTNDFTNSIVFSAGCHAGYNLVDGDAIPGVTLPLDWAQAFARKQATLIAGTGYQYGDTDFLEYSERLYNSFARQLRAGPAGTPVTVGEALVQAKLAYLAATPDIRGLHEKALLEATLFGLPMLAVNMPAGRGALPGTAGVVAPTLVAPGPAKTLGLQTYDLGVAPDLMERTQTLTSLSGGPNVTATWLSGPDGVVTKPGEPALPLAVVNVTPTVPSMVLRGIGYRGGSYVDSGPLVPFTGAATTESRGVHVPFLSPVFYPTTMWTPNYFGALAGNGGTQLLVSPAQYRAASVTDGTSTQRKHTAMNLRLFYSDNLSQAALSDAPSIVAVDAQQDATGVTFSAQVIGDPAAAIYQVWVTYTGGGTWTSLDLSQCVSPLPAACGAGEDSRVWKGRLGSPPGNLKYFVQAANGVGLVSRNDNAGAFFGINSVLPTATALALVSPPSSAIIGDSPTVTAKLTYAGGVALAGKMVSVGTGGASRLGVTGNDGSISVKMPVVADPGSYQITAAFAGDDVFQPSSVSAPFTINPAAATPTVLPAGAASAGINISGALGGTSAGLQQVPVAFTVNGPNGTTTVYSITDYLGNAIFPPPSGLPPGTYTLIQAAFGGDGTFAPTTITFPPGSQVAVPKLNQSIDFDALADKAFGDPDFPLFASASSGLAVSYGASGACTVAGNAVHVTGTGSCTIDGDQAGDATFNPAVRVSRTFAIATAINGFLDMPTTGSAINGRIWATGWTFGGSGIVEVQIQLDGNTIGTATRGLSRPDIPIGFPGAPADSGYTFSFNSALYANGAHALSAVAIDSGGHTRTWQVPITINQSQDLLPPFGFLDAPVANSTVSGSVPVIGWAIDNVAISTISILLDGNVIGTATAVDRPSLQEQYPGAPLNSGYQFTFNTTIYPDGTHIIVSRAVDSSGNPFTQQATITIANQGGGGGPTVSSLVRAVNNPTMADLVTYTLTFSEPVSGVTSSNFQVVTSSITGAVVGTISGADGTATRTVGVNTGRGTGTLHLDVVTGTGITNAGGTPLAGTPFTGETFDIDKGGTVVGSGEGQLATGFGSGGYALFGDVQIPTVPGRMRVLSNGQIFAAGGAGCASDVNPGNPPAAYCTLQLARYSAGGVPDPSFGVNGRLVTAVTNVLPEVNVNVLSDGSSIVRGVRYNGANDVVFAAKFTSAGTSDLSYGTNGVVTLNSLPLGFGLTGSVLDASGRIVIVGTTPDTGVGEREDIFVTRLTSTGATDTTFGTNGVAQFAISAVDNRSDRGTTIDVQPDGKIVIGGRTKVTAGLGYDFLLMRLDATGVPDPSFGTNGVATTRFPGSTSTNLGRRMVLQPDGKIVLVGGVAFSGPTIDQCGIARFDAGGVLDPGFGAGGRVLVPMTVGCFDINQQSDGKLVISGDDQTGDVFYGTFVRLQLNGTPDTGFGNAGRLQISNFDTPTRVTFTSSGNLVTGLTIQDPADGVRKSYVVELTTTLAGPWLNQSITFGALPDRAFGDVFQLSATASSGLPVTYAASGGVGVCTVAGNVVQLTGVGTCTITATQGGNATYFAAAPVARTFVVTSANQAITFAPAPTGVTAEQLLVTVTASSSSPTSAPSTIPIVFTSLTPSVCQWGGFGGSSVTFLASGTCTIAANQAGNAFYNAAPQATLDIPVAAALPPPTTFLVTTNNNGGAGSLRDAIAQANAAPGPNAISFFGVTGLITLTSPIQISGPLLITGPGADQLTISGGNTTRIFSIVSATNPACPTLEPVPDYLVSISGLRLANANANNPDSYGGAIYTGHSLVLDSMVIENSIARSGGAVAVGLQYPGQSLTVNNSKFIENTARDVQVAVTSSTAGGGAIVFQDRCIGPVDTIGDLPSVAPVTLTIANSEFRGNAANPVLLNGRGGAIRSYSLADITISDTVFSENGVFAPNPPVAGRAYQGGAISATGRSLRIERSEISENVAFDETGADVTRSGGLHLTNDSLNRQGPGDAMAAKIVNSTISNNFSSATAGAMVGFANVALEIDNSTIADNSAPPTRTGGVILNAGATYPVSNGTTARPSLTIVSSILANNSSSGGDLVTSSAGLPTLTVNAANSLIERVCPAGGGCGALLVAGSGNLISVDPVQGPLAFNGGTSRTHALLPGSPAINAGSNPLGLATDQRGAGFPRVVGGAADMGAYESGTPVPLTNFAYSSKFGSVGNGDGQFSVPVGVAIDPSTRNIVVVDSSNHRVQRFDFGGSYLGQFGSVGSLDGQFSSPYMAAIDPTNRNIAVTDLGNNRVQIFNLAGGFLSKFGTFGTGDGQFQNPVGVLITPSHETCVVDHTNNRLQCFDFANTFEGKLGSLGSGDGQFNAPDGIALDTTLGNFIVADTGNNRVQVFDGEGSYLFQFGTQGNGPGQFNQPSGVAVDPTSHNIIVADYGNDRVQVFNSAGVFLSQFGGTGTGNGQFNRPYGVAIDPVSHNIVVVDQNNNRVQIFAPQ